MFFFKGAPLINGRKKKSLKKSNLYKNLAFLATLVIPSTSNLLAPDAATSPRTQSYNNLPTNLPTSPATLQTDAQTPIFAVTQNQWNKILANLNLLEQNLKSLNERVTALENRGPTQPSQPDPITPTTVTPPANAPKSTTKPKLSSTETTALLKQANLQVCANYKVKSSRQLPSSTVFQSQMKNKKMSAQALYSYWLEHYYRNFFAKKYKDTNTALTSAEFKALNKQIGWEG